LPIFICGWESIRWRKSSTMGWLSNIWSS